VFAFKQSLKDACHSTFFYLKHQIVFDRFLWKCYTHKIHRIQKLKFLVQLRIKTKSQFEFVPRDIKESEFLGNPSFSHDANRCTSKCICEYMYINMYIYIYTYIYVGHSFRCMYMHHTYIWWGQCNVCVILPQNYVYMHICVRIRIYLYRWLHGALAGRVWWISIYVYLRYRCIWIS